MIKLSENNFFFILLGIFLINLYFDNRFKGFILTSVWCFAIAFLHIIPAKLVRLLVFAGLMGIALMVSLLEADDFRRRGIPLIKPSKKNYVIGLSLVVIYTISKILYFDGR